MSSGKFDVSVGCVHRWAGGGRGRVRSGEENNWNLAKSYRRRKRQQSARPLPSRSTAASLKADCWHMKRPRPQRESAAKICRRRRRRRRAHDTLPSQVSLWAGALNWSITRRAGATRRLVSESSPPFRGRTERETVGPDARVVGRGLVSKGVPGRLSAARIGRPGSGGLWRSARRIGAEQARAGRTLRNAKSSGWRRSGAPRSRLSGGLLASDPPPAIKREIVVLDHVRDSPPI